jgi:capsular exopolysaccharide synthesis family protein
MSRVDEALKRARSLKGESHDGSATDLHTVEAPVVASWQYERFPTERDEPPGFERRISRPPLNVARSNATATVPSATQVPKIALRPAGPGPSPAFAEKIIGGASATAGREHYDRVATALHQAQRQQNTKLVMFTSAMPGEGKSLTAANVALTLSLYGRRVLLVDADLHKPTLHELFQISNAKGLLDGLGAGFEKRMAVTEVAPNLFVLPAGHSTAEPMSLLISDRMRQVLREASEAFDWVIVDTPPICLVSDAHVLAGIVEAAVLVIKAGSTAHELISAAVTTLGRERILGVVLNCVDDRDIVGGQDRYGYGYGYGYGHGRGNGNAHTQSPGGLGLRE